jgi:hypothetical protein
MKSWPIGAALLGLTLTLTSAGCGGSSGGGSFTCVQNSQCNASTGGICIEPAGHCAYPDATCASGYRYGGQSGSASNLCVASDGGQTTIDMGVRPDMPVTNVDMGVSTIDMSTPPDTLSADTLMGDTVIPGATGVSRFAFTGGGATVTQSTSTNWKLNNAFGQGSPLGPGPSTSTNFAVGQGVLGGK